MGWTIVDQGQRLATAVLVLTGFVTAAVVGAPAARAADCAAVSNFTDQPIGASLGGTSQVTVTGCDRPASATAQIQVDIKLGWRAHTAVYLAAPDGTRYVLRFFGFDYGSDIKETYTADLSAHAANGTWKLVVSPQFAEWPGDYIDSWTLTP